MKIDFKKFRKKPVVIQAAEMGCDFTVPTLEGKMQGSKGDFLIIGVRGEAYPCKREIFFETYEDADQVEKKVVKEIFNKGSRPKRLHTRAVEIRPKILKMLRSESKLKIIAERLHVSEKTVWYHLNKLRKEGLVKRKGKGNINSYWILITKRGVQSKHVIPTMVKPDHDAEYMARIKEKDNKVKRREDPWCPYCLDKKLKSGEEYCPDCKAAFDSQNKDKSEQ